MRYRFKMCQLITISIINLIFIYIIINPVFQVFPIHLYLPDNKNFYNCSVTIGKLMIIRV